MKRGFTLLELVGVITLLGVLAVVAIPMVTSNLRKFENDSYQKQLDSICLIAQEWEANHPLELTGTNTVTITLGTLKTDGYLEGDIINPKTNQPFASTLSIKLTKENKHVSCEI